MDLLMMMAAIVAFAPTLALMYIVLRKYTYPAVEQPFFSDPAFFGLFTVGLIAGTFLFAVYTWIWTSMIYAILFAAIICLVLVMVLNLKRFHGKSDSVFYGYGLGLGVGCTMAFGMIFYLGTTITGSDIGNLEVTDYIMLFIIGLGNILMISAVGTIIGEGIARLRPMEFALQAMMACVLYFVVTTLAYLNSDNSILFYAGLIIGLVFSASYFYYVMYIKLSEVIRDVLKMEGNKRKDVPR